VNARDGSGNTPLHEAALAGFKSVAEVLLAAKADANARNKHGDTPLHQAAAAGQSAVVELLLAHKAEVNAKNTGPADNNRDSLQRTHDATPLVEAILGNHVAVVKLLLAAKAEVNFECEAGGIANLGGMSPIIKWGSPLHFAIWGNSPEIVPLLLDSGANPNAQAAAPGETAAGMTPLRAAVLDGQKETVQLLLAHKADPNIPDGEGKTPLHYAVAGRSKELVKLLLANHADVNRRDQSGLTPLAYAALALDTDTAAALLDAKADPNIKDQNGQTPLHHAVLQGPQRSEARKEMVELLLAKGADPNVRDKFGNTPLSLAKRPRAGAPQPVSTEIAELLRKHGAVEELPRMDVIEVGRPSANFSEVVFTKGTNDYNHFTLFEAIAAHYGFVTARAPLQQTYHYGSVMTGSASSKATWTRQGSLAFPDLNSVTIRRPTEGGLGWAAIKVNLNYALLQPPPDCSGDQQLQWGDVVEIPEADHPINAVWQGLPEEILITLKGCVDRQVQLTVKGQTTNLPLSLQTTAPPAPGYHEAPARTLGTPPSFALLPVLQSSGLLRASSDLSRVKVKRREGATGQAYELVFDCSNGSGPGPDFWLRNGDAIEVPEKP